MIKFTNLYCGSSYSFPRIDPLAVLEFAFTGVFSAALLFYLDRKDKRVKLIIESISKAK